MCPELIAQRPRDVSTVRSHAVDGDDAVVGEALQILEELLAREVLRRWRQIRPVSQVGVRFNDAGHDGLARQVDSSSPFRDPHLTASADRRERAILNQECGVFNGRGFVAGTQARALE
jgi:hypothetical protein